SAGRRLFAVDAGRAPHERPAPRAHPLGRLVGEGEAELPLAQADELLERHLDPRAHDHGALDGGELGEAVVEGRRLGRERGHHQAVLADDASLPGPGEDRQVARLLAEGDDLDDVEEREVLEVAGEAHGSTRESISEPAAPLPWFYTAASISAAR